MLLSRKPVTRRLKILFAGLTLVAALPVAAQTTLKLAHFVPPAHVITPSIVEPLVDGVKAASDGELEIQVYPGGELGPGPVEQYVRAVNGVADITFGLSGYTSSQFPKSMIVELPGVVEQAGSGYGALWRVYEQHLQDEFPGTKPLALWVSEPLVLIMKDKEIRAPGDLAGLKVRVSGAVPGKVIEALGATPVQMPAPQMYNALQTGLVDGILTGASAIRDFRLNEVASIFVEGPTLGHIMFYLVMNRAVYDGLSDTARSAVDASSGESLSASGEAGWRKVADDTMAALRADPAKTVITLSQEDSAPFNEIALKVRDTLIAEMEADGVPAGQILKAMQDG